jgi:predicted GTPase
LRILETTENIQKLFEEYELCRLQASQVKTLADKLRNKSVTLAVIGQFKRGKTTMVNSILGEKLLPVGIVPVTAAVTRIEYGSLNAEVHYFNGLSEKVPIEDLYKYISEQENHENRKGVTEVSLHIESDFLKDGLILVDTPGVGSVHEKNSKSAYDFVRESDGVIFMLSVDSPVNRIEVEFLKSVRRFAGKFYFVVNKVDTVEPADLEEYMEYCTMLLSDIMGCENLHLIPISAKKGNGIDVLTGLVRTDILNKSEEIMEESVRLKLLEILESTRAQIRSYRQVLQMAPNVFNMRFRELGRMLEEYRESDRKMLISEPECKILRARLNERKSSLVIKVKELFGIEYYYSRDCFHADEIINCSEYAEEMEETYNQLEHTINTIFMYKEKDVYTVARRIEDLNILMREMRIFSQRLEKKKSSGV